MNKFSLPVKNALAAWGASRRELPQNSTALKSAVLSKLSHGSADPEPPRHVPWFSLALAGMAAVSLIVIAAPNAERSFQTTTPAATESKGSGAPLGELATGGYGAAANADKARRASEPAPDDFADPEVPASDGRQFLKTDYSASAETRNVPKMVRLLQSTVKGYDGRVDGLRSGKESGYIEFVVPASRFESFRAELTSLVGEKFFTEYVTTENLLPEKRAIEDRRVRAETALEQLKADREKLVASHRQTAGQIQSQINTVNKELADVETQLALTVNPDQRALLEARRQELQRSRANLQARLGDENWRYTASLGQTDARVKAAEDSIDNTEKQDVALQDTVATVRGTVSVSWISLWEAGTRYVPGYWLPIGLLVAAAFAYLHSRRRNAPSGI